MQHIPDMVPEGDINLLPRENIAIRTGTQGEPRAAMAKIAAGMHESVSLDPGDTVIYSSRQIPGNEPAIARVQDMLIRRKINLVTDDDAPVHVSGHPSRDEMIEMYGLVRPRIAIPVHGTARHLIAHAELAESRQVQQTLLPIMEPSFVLRTPVPMNSWTQRLLTCPYGCPTHDKGQIVEIQSDMMRARRRMLWNGAVTASVVLNMDGGLCAVPVVSQTGISNQSDDYMASASLAIEDALAGMSRNEGV